MIETLNLAKSEKMCLCLCNLLGKNGRSHLEDTVSLARLKTLSRPGESSGVSEQATLALHSSGSLQVTSVLAVELAA